MNLNYHIFKINDNKILLSNIHSEMKINLKTKQQEAK